MPRTPSPTADQLRQLPACHTETIPYDYIDAYGHMNVRYYFALWEKAAHGFMKHLGADVHAMLERDRGNWVLRQVVDYLAEVREGDTLTVYGRLVGFTPKRLHNKYWMFNETRGSVAAASEVLVTCADLKARRTAPFPEDMADGIRARLSEFDALDWTTPVSGAIQA
jgi:acyl-CoA thioester hydrolase